MKETEWLCELSCSECKNILYAQVGNQDVPQKEIDSLKCCEKMEIKTTFTPIEEPKQ